MAAERIVESSRGVARALDRFVQAGFIRGLDARARRRLAAAAQATSPSERDGLLRGAEGHAKTMMRERTLWGDPLVVTPGRKQGKNLVVILVDTVRADLVGAYGSRDNITPNIDRLAAQSVRFSEMTSNDRG